MLPKSFLVVLLIFLLPTLLLAQQHSIDSLSNQLKTKLAHRQKPDTALVNLLNALSGAYIQKVSDSAFVVADKAMKMAVQLHDINGQAMAFANQAKMHYQKGNYPESLMLILTALQLSSQINDTGGMANAHNLMGLIYLSQGQVNSAINEFKTAIISNNRTKNLQQLSANYFNLGLCYFQVKTTDSSLYYFLKAQTLSKAIHDQHMLAMASNRLGDYYNQRGLTDKAVRFYSSVLDNKTYQNDWENSFAYAGLAESHLKKKQYVQAISNGQTALQLAKKTGAKWDMERAMKILYVSYRSLGKPQQAYDYLLMDKLYSDSLFTESKEKEINGLYLKQKQAENEILIKKNLLIIKDNRISRLLNWIVGLGALLLFVTAFLFYRNAAKQRRLNKVIAQKSKDISRQSELIERQNTELQRLNQTKDQLFSVIGHDLRSPFSAILGMLSFLKAGELDREEQGHLFNVFFDQVTVTAAMLDNLLLWADSQKAGITINIAEVSLPGIINEVLQIMNVLAIEKGIIIQHQADPRAIIAADHDQVRIIFQNIIANAVKFTRQGGHIAISYRITDASVSIAIQDDGVGMSPAKLKELFNQSGKNITSYGTNQEKGIGIGLLLVKKFAGQNNATIRVDSIENDGTVFTFDFQSMSSMLSL